MIWRRYLKPFHMEGKNIFILCTQYHDCCCHGDTTRASAALLVAYVSRDILLTAPKGITKNLDVMARFVSNVMLSLFADTLVTTKLHS